MLIDEVGAQPGQRPQPALLLALAAHHVDVGDLEDAQRAHPRRQYGDGDPPQAEGAGLETGGVGEAGRADCRDSQGYSVSRAHRPIVADRVVTSRRSGPGRHRAGVGGALSVGRCAQLERA